MRTNLALAIALTVVAGLASTGAGQCGPFLLKDINPNPCDAGVGPCGSSPEELTRVGDAVFFRALDIPSGDELWKSDGTSAGTVRVADICPGPISSNPSQLTEAGGVLYFVEGGGLWKSDGTSEGTVRISEMLSLPSVLVAPKLTAVGDTLFLADGLKLWMSDGTVDGTQRLVDFGGHSPSGYWQWNFTAVGSDVLFTICDSGGNCELWRTDRTAAGTERVATIVPPCEDGYADPDASPGLQAFASSDEMVFFAACVLGGECDLYRTDGTADGTNRIVTFSPSDGIHDHWAGPQIAVINGGAVFPACDGLTGCELWTSDGTAEGTRLLVDISPGVADSFGERDRGFVHLGNVVLFNATVNGDSGLWSTDGTAVGTVLLSSEAGLPSIYADNIAIYMRQNEVVPTLWQTDGTPQGTMPFPTLPDPTWFPMLSSNAVRIGGRVLFSGANPARGFQLWALSLAGANSDVSCVSDNSLVTSTTTTSTTTSTMEFVQTTTSTTIGRQPTCEPSRLMSRLQSDLERVPGCDESSARDRRRRRRYVRGFERTVARAVRAGRLSAECGNQLLQQVSSCAG